MARWNSARFGALAPHSATTTLSTAASLLSASYLSLRHSVAVP
ncbi:MAG: hypothetical protein ACO2PN_17280 [Pyrobaculum sp.]